MMVASLLLPLLVAAGAIIGWLVSEWRTSRLYWRVGLGAVSIIGLTALFSLPSHINAYYVDWNHRQSAHLMVQLLEKDGVAEVHESLASFLHENVDRDALAAASRLHSRLADAHVRLYRTDG